jgi:hypothetical protein
MLKDSENFTDKEENKDMSSEGNGPVLERIDDLESLIRTGAEVLGKEVLLNTSNAEEA